MTGSDPATYTVRLEYPAIAYAYQEVTAASPDEAVELAREMESNGKIIFDEDHETLASETTVTVWSGHDTDVKPLRVLPSETERLISAAPHLVAALGAITGYAHSRAEDMHEAAEASASAQDFALWLTADAAVTAAEQ